MTGSQTLKTGGLLDIHRVNAHRSLLMAALAAFAGLGMAGYSLFTAPGTTTLLVPAEDVALVNQQPVARSDFQQTLRALLGDDHAQATPAQKTHVLEEMIREELYVQRGKELDVASTDPEVRAAMVSAVEQSIAADATSSVPSDEQLKSYYEKHKSDYATVGALNVRHLVFPAGTGAAARDQLGAGKPAAQVMAALGGREGSGTSGSEYYFAAKIHLGEPLFAAASVLPAGGVSRPVSLPDGEHILIVLTNEKPQPQGFATAHLQVFDDYQKEVVAKSQAAERSFLRRRANVQIAKDLR